MLDKQFLKTKEGLVEHKSFILQEVVRWDVRTGGSLEKAQFQTKISTEKYVVDYSFEWADAVYFSTTICGSEL
jgi:hypothetical protein